MNGALLTSSRHSHGLCFQTRRSIQILRIEAVMIWAAEALCLYSVSGTQRQRDVRVRVTPHSAVTSKKMQSQRSQTYVNRFQCDQLNDYNR